MKKVLVAEDSSVIQNITKKVLEHEKFLITSVKNGQQVLDKLAIDSFDIILLDINMPLMDGMVCAQHIRKLPDPEKANIPIIAITGNAKNYSLDEFRAVGINEYLPKPLNFDMLLEVVKKLTEK